MRSEKNFPKLIKTSDMLILRLSKVSGLEKKINIEFILDINKNGEIIGIEIINLKYHTGFKGITKFPEEKFTIHYDQESDAISIWFPKEHSIEQKTVNGVVLLDENTYIVGFEINLKPD